MRYSDVVKPSVATALCLLVVACQSVPPPVADLEDLLDRLYNATAEVEITSRTVRNIYLSTKGLDLLTNGENVNLFEYENATTARMEFEALTSRLGPGLVFFEEGEPPLTEIVPARSHIRAYCSGRFVLLYNGEDEEVLRVLRLVMGCSSGVRQL